MNKHFIKLSLLVALCSIGHDAIANDATASATSPKTGMSKKERKLLNQQKQQARRISAPRSGWNAPIEEPTFVASSAAESVRTEADNERAQEQAQAIHQELAGAQQGVTEHESPRPSASSSSSSCSFEHCGCSRAAQAMAALRVSEMKEQPDATNETNFKAPLDNLLNSNKPSFTSPTKKQGLYAIAIIAGTYTVYHWMKSDNEEKEAAPELA